MAEQEKWNVTIHSDNLDKDGIKRVIVANDDKYHRHDFIQCYADSATLNVGGVGVHAFAMYPAEVMDAICDEWQRFRRELVAHEQRKAKE